MTTHIEIVPVIMSGGSGSRLWPLSTDSSPKQFHPLVSSLTMFQETVLRVGAGADVNFLAPVVICSGQHELLVREQLNTLDIQPSMLVLEPFGRNTAAVAAMAAVLVRERHPGALVLLLPADHVIADVAAFRAAVERAADTGRANIVTFGIVPTGPATGYGYIKYGEAVADGVFAIEAFKEKPSADLAQAYLDFGGYYWNAGIFLYAPEVLIREMRQVRPDIVDASEATLGASEWRGDALPLDPGAFASCPGESIDCAVMEHTAAAALAPCDIGWADVGSWGEVWRLRPHDSAGNAVRGDALAIDSRNCLVWSEKKRVIALGLEDLVIVETEAAIIVLPKSRSQDVRQVVAQLAETNARGSEP